MIENKLNEIEMLCKCVEWRKDIDYINFKSVDELLNDEICSIFILFDCYKDDISDECDELNIINDINLYWRIVFNFHLFCFYCLPKIQICPIIKWKGKSECGFLIPFTRAKNG